jgi:prolyl-tRNA synthetase
MRYSQMFIPTLKEAPADAQVASHKLLVRAGFVRQLSAGIYSILPLAQRSLNKIHAVIREEMAAIGAQEFYLPALNPREIWEETGRWTGMGDNMFRLKDRKGADLCLGMTHEEVFTHIARNELRSYKQLPQTWYQIQTKFRDEPRPKSGLLRVRQFTMKDSYSFDHTWEGLDTSFENHRRAYERIFSRCGLVAVQVDADTGAMGGKASTEFMVKTDAGEDLIAFNVESKYAANVEKATSVLPKEIDEDGPAAPEKFATPGVKTIEDLEKAPYGVSGKRQVKTLVYMADDKLVLALVRGDHDLQEAKLGAATGATMLRPAHPEEIRAALGALPGSLGAVGVKGVRVLADHALEGRKNMVTGANEDGFHLRGVTMGRDIKPEWTDLRTVKAGELDPKGQRPLEVAKALEVGHIFKLGLRYSEAMKASVLGPDGKETPVIMGSYGIGVERILAAAVELHNDADGILWPMTIAPFHVALLPLQGNDPDVQATTQKLYADLQAAGVDVLLDDRDERPGVKFKDADLVGLPIRIAVGKKGLAEGKVEWKRRDSKDVELVAVADLVAKAKDAVKNG